MKPIEFFRKEMDAVLDFFIVLSNPKYLTKEGQEVVDKFLRRIKKISKNYLNKLIKGGK